MDKQKPSNDNANNHDHLNIFINEKEAAIFVGSSVRTLQGWRVTMLSKRHPSRATSRPVLYQVALNSRWFNPDTETAYFIVPENNIIFAFDWKFDVINEAFC